MNILPDVCALDKLFELAYSVKYTMQLFPSVSQRMFMVFNMVIIRFFYVTEKFMFCLISQKLRKHNVFNDYLVVCCSKKVQVIGALIISQ